MILSPGDKVHIVTRRQFPEDIRRHFVGEVAAVQAALIRVTGYVFVYEAFEERFARRPEVRSRVFNCGDSGPIVNILPTTTEPDKVVYAVSNENRLVATDGRDFLLDINEFSDRR